jgi:hypothetical protein
MFFLSALFHNMFRPNSSSSHGCVWFVQFYYCVEVRGCWVHVCVAPCVFLYDVITLFYCFFGTVVLACSLL